MKLISKTSIALLFIGIIFISEVTCADTHKKPPKWLDKILHLVLKKIEGIKPGILEKLTKILNHWTERIRARTPKH
ncbi:hypothetical protein CDAR_84061 [Caerostris darwini]|uniref:Uncharacterized protein n=1 Tax=Caerostris darwini TaxID=1538125 RepID=A0AAV4U6J9_9ARAC|nr:hypothetical protein CDAR_84061 [Caerostris darwini]